MESPIRMNIYTMFRCVYETAGTILFKWVIKHLIPHGALIGRRSHHHRLVIISFYTECGALFSFQIAFTFSNGLRFVCEMIHADIS